MRDFFWILNTLPVRAKVWANGWLLLLPLQGVGNGGMVPRALPWARDLLPFQGARGEGCGDSIVAHFARKVRGAKVGAQHELKIQQSHAPERWSCSLRVRGPHFASKVSYSASPQSLAPKKFVNSFNSLLCRPRPIIKFVVMLRPSPSPPRNSLIRLIRCYAVRGQ